MKKYISPETEVMHIQQQSIIADSQFKTIDEYGYNNLLGDEDVEYVKPQDLWDNEW